LINAVAREVSLFAERREAQAEKKRMAEQLRHADRLATVGQLAAGLAHELNEPLGAILGFSQLAKKAPQLPEGAGRDIDKVIEAALHAREIVGQLMLFARRSPPTRAWVKLNTVVDGSLALVAARITDRGVTVVRDFEPRLPAILADAVQLHQVVVNLAVNALQALHDGGTLTLRTRSEPLHVTLTVEDSGTGMTPDVAARAFEPFFTTRNPGEGTGLGLSIVQGIVLSHGGTIEFDSRPDAGTRFVVRLPRSGGEVGGARGASHG
jgi:C4-dicarboxylate-specific signal transduction histidine kinase